MKFIAIIPARYASTRFLGKALALLGGKPMIQCVYEQVQKALDEVWVATDDKRIFDAVTGFGGKVVMTSAHHQSGSDRIYEAYLNIGSTANVIVNVQGDEPFIQVEQIEALLQCFDNESVEIATLVKPFTEEDGIDALLNPNTPKVVVNKHDEAILFSRAVIPYLRGVAQQDWIGKHLFYKHIGVYAYRADVLQKITQLPPSPLEKAESLEQLRWIENGYHIKVGYTTIETIGIDTPEDLERAIYLRKE